MDGGKKCGKWDSKIERKNCAFCAKEKNEAWQPGQVKW